jgi:hypothetical protein
VAGKKRRKQLIDNQWFVIKKEKNMSALILNGEEMDGFSLTQISKIIKEELRANDFEVEDILLKEKEIAACLGCF